MSGVVVLGAGVAGVAAATRLLAEGVSCEIFEAGGAAGGHATSFAVGGFMFDQGPHISFTRHDEVKALFAAAVDSRFLEQEARVLNCWQGVWIPHPAQCHLFGLPLDVVERCVVDFVERPTTTSPSPSYAEWCLATFGKAFSEEFSFRYTRKHWAAEADQLTSDWVGKKIYSPTLNDLVRGALGPSTRKYYYVSSFRYPERGGFGAYALGTARALEVRTGMEAVELSLGTRRVAFADGSDRRWEHLVSSLPLPELVHLTTDAPRDVREAAEALACTSLELVSVGVDRRDGFPDAHWVYFYDEDVLFSRASFPHRFSPANAPEGQGSIQAEVYHSRYRPLAQRDILGRVIEDMRRVGLLTPSDRLLVADHRTVRYANVLFDRARAEAVARVRSHYDRHGVLTVGRYGAWDYSWTDDAVLSGWRAAAAVAARRAPGVLRPSTSAPSR